MKTTRTALVLCLVALCGAGGSTVLPAPSPQPPETVELVEEHWPDGSLRLRKQVLRREDGSVVDHGAFERWHDNGEKEYEAVFVHGKKEGTTVRYHKNGRKATQQEYKGGKRHGRCVTWNASGEMVKEEHWAEGKPHGTWTVWEAGKVKWHHSYEHGVPAPVPEKPPSP